MRMLCEFCKLREAEYEGWFRTAAAFNPYAKGTASAGLLQRRKVCHTCAEKAIESKVAVGNLPEKEEK